MKSSLFSRFDFEQEENLQFAKDLKVLLALSPEQYEALLGAYQRWILERDDLVKDELLAEARVHADIDEYLIRHVFDFTSYFLRQLDDEQTEKDAPEDWADDLESAGILDADSKPRFVDFSKRLKEELAPELHRLARERVTEQGVLPFLSSVGTTVELRAVLEEHFRWGRLIAEYTPVIEGVVPVISVQLGLDSGPYKSITFQASVPVIQRLMDSMTAAVMTAESLEAAVSVQAQNAQTGSA